MPAAIPYVVAAAGTALAANQAKKGQEAQAKAMADANEKGSVPGYARPYVDEAMTKAQAVANTPFQAYDKPLVAGTNQFEQAAQQGVMDWQKGTPQSTQAAAGYANMVTNPSMFTQGAAPTSNAYADNHLGTLSQAQAQNTTASLANNSYIGAQSQGIAGVDKIGANMGTNQYLGQSAGSVSAGKNPMLGLDNPYLSKAIDYATEDISRAYDKSIRPMQAQRAAMSGSFGNSGVEEANAEDARNYAGQLGRTVSGMRMQDYTAQQGLYENDVNRQLGAQQFNVQSRANDLGRNLGGMFQQMGMGLDAERSNAANQLSTQQFNATLGQNDLARNAQLSQQQGQYNASALTGADQWNAGNNTQNNQFNTSAANGMSLANAGIQNDTNRFNVTNLNNSSNFNANAANQMRMFNSTQTANMYGQGLNGLMDIDQRGLQGANALNMIGQQQRGIDQMGANSAYEQFMRQQNDPLQKSQGYNAALGSLVHGSTPMMQQQQPSAALQGLQTGMGIYSMFNQGQGGWGGNKVNSGQGYTGIAPAGSFYDGHGVVSNTGNYNTTWG